VVDGEELVVTAIEHVDFGIVDIWIEGLVANSIVGSEVVRPVRDYLLFVDRIELCFDNLTFPKDSLNGKRLTSTGLSSAKTRNRKLERSSSFDSNKRANRERRDPPGDRD
jgi:hypothetical protein